MQKDIIIFGAGQFGRMALLKYGDRVDYFIDNDERLQGRKIKGIEVRSVKDSIKDFKSHNIILASKYPNTMEEQLRMLGTDNYSFYSENSKAYYETEKLVINPYLDNCNRDISETEWNEINKNNYAIEVINSVIESLKDQNPMFDHVEIETINRCNGNCGFCPVSKKNDTRVFQTMEEDLFRSIIKQLAEIKYDGKLALFSNNEPLLDPEILQRHEYARKLLPAARMHLFTNGTLLTLEKFKKLMQYLDELIIDNYQSDLKLIAPCKEIVKYCNEHNELKRKVTIVLRKPQEILSTRGGEAPNRKNMISYENAKCILPYKQLIIRPDGKVSLCCNDPLGKITLGDLKKEGILEVWNNTKYKMVREALYKGRSNLEHCRYCDVFNLG